MIRAWIDPNNNNAYITDIDTDSCECWCHDCEETTYYNEIKEDEQ